MDKKTERNILYSHTTKCAQKIEDSSNIDTECLGHACTLLLARMESIHMVPPADGSAHGILIRLLTTIVSPSVGRLLLAALDCLVGEENENVQVLNGLKSLCPAKKSQLKTMVIEGYEDAKDE
jgi:hypothetical protein